MFTHSDVICKAIRLSPTPLACPLSLPGVHITCTKTSAGSLSLVF